jgi:hypothetical protein
MQPTIFATDILRLQRNPMTVAQYEEMVQGELVALDVGTIDLQREIIDTENKTAALRVNIHINLKDGSRDVLDVMFILDMTDDCEQIKAVVEFADTAKIRGVVAKIHEIAMMDKIPGSISPFYSQRSHCPAVVASLVVSSRLHLLFHRRSAFQLCLCSSIASRNTIIGLCSSKGI